MAQLVTLLLLLIAAGAAFFGTDNAIKALKGGDRPDTKSAAALNEVLSEANKRQLSETDQQNVRRQLPFFSPPVANSTSRETINQTPVFTASPSTPLPSPTTTTVIPVPTLAPAAPMGTAPAVPAVPATAPSPAVVPPVKAAPVKGMW
jgi:hypothetical protein